MKLKINKAKIVAWKYWNSIFINQVGLYDDKWKWIKWVKLNDELLNVLTTNYINYEPKREK